MKELIKQWAIFKKEYAARFTVDMGLYRMDDQGVIYTAPTLEQFLDWLEAKEEV